jgi:hypothetical protein
MASLSDLQAKVTADTVGGGVIAFFQGKNYFVGAYVGDDSFVPNEQHTALLADIEAATPVPKAKKSAKADTPSNVDDLEL